ncbi:MAG: radical SAM family heme chaperone HemW, partial [Clostridia bacterium]|nr:radical SAM family heme chaperone HemW [Clostridia bacterium]
MSGDLGVYFHIPFCRSKCAYCDFCSTAKWDDKLMDTYLEALFRQLDDFFLPGGKYTVDTVYIGGGTPSVFQGKRIAKLLKQLGKRADLTRNCETTVEVNPESADKALFKQLKKAGVNRISMGVQSADDSQLRRIGRIHDFAKAREAAALCRQYCTDNLSLDLIYGLPGQSLESWLQSVDAVCALQPRHISCYSLKLEEGTPLWREDPVLPDDDLQADMYLAAVSRLAEKGYAQYEISNFAQQGFRSRHNSRYWDLSDYLGFGCAAHSFYGGKRFSFTSDINAYIRGMHGQDPIVEEADELAFRDRVGEFVMLALRTCDGI